MFDNERNDLLTLPDEVLIEVLKVALGRLADSAVPSPTYNETYITVNNSGACGRMGEMSVGGDLWECAPPSARG